VAVVFRVVNLLICRAPIAARLPDRRSRSNRP
jgi:hypothetical protein